MSWFFSRKKPEVFDPDPGEIDWMPARPCRVLHANLPFYCDPECSREVEDGRLVVLRWEDRRQTHRAVECMPTRKRYKTGQLVQWELNNKKMWETSWYKDPETGNPVRAWPQAVEFIGRIVNIGESVT